MRRKTALSRALKIDYGVMVCDIREQLRENNKLIDLISLSRENCQAQLFDYIDREIAIQREVYMEMLRAYWTLHFDSTPFEEQTVRHLVDEHLEKKRQRAREIATQDLAEQEDHERMSIERPYVRLKLRLLKVSGVVKAAWKSTTPLEAGLNSAALVVGISFIPWLWVQDIPLPLLAFPFGALVGFLCGGIRLFQIEEERRREWRMRYMSRR